MREKVDARQWPGKGVLIKDSERKLQEQFCLFVVLASIPAHMSLRLLSRARSCRKRLL